MKKQILILGGGFAGVRSALSVAKIRPRDNVVLVSHNSFHLYHAALYEVATAVKTESTALLLKGTVAVPFLDIVKKYKNLTFKQGWVTNIDLDRRIVQTDDGDLAYDGLVVALGSTSDDYGIPGLSENSVALKSFNDAVEIRNRVEAALKKYKETNDGSYLTFVIGGGGFTGVELSAELVNYIKHLYRHFGEMPKYRLVVIEASSQLLMGLPLSISNQVAEYLESMGIEIKLSMPITSVDKNGVTLSSGERINSKTVIWTGGVKAAPIPFTKNIARDKKGRVIVSSRLNLDSHPEAFVIGDSSCYMEAGKPLPPTATVALHEAHFAAAALDKTLTGGEAPVYRPPRLIPFLIPLSGKRAAYVRQNKVWYGFGAYVLRRLADLRYFLSILPWWKALPFWWKGSMIYLRND